MISKPLFLIMTDGLGYYQIKEEQMPFLTDLLSRDKHKLRTPLGYSGAIHASLFTGCNPRIHGVWNYILRYPNESTYNFIKYMPWLVHLDRLNKMFTVPFKVAIRFFLKKRNKTIPLLTSSSQLLELTANCPSIYPKTRFGVPSAFDIFSDSKIAYTFIHNSDFGRIKMDATQIPLNQHIRFSYILVSIDEYFHHKGVEHPETLKHMKKIDSFLEMLFTKIGKRFSDFDYIVLSDHGFCPVQSKIDIEKLLENVHHGNMIMFTDATMARFWFFSDKSRGEVESCLKGLRFGKILDGHLRAEFGIDFSQNFYGDVIFLFHPGIMPFPDSWGMCIGRRPVVAAHGYDPRHRLMHGFLTSNIDVKGDPINVTDVLPTVLDYWELEIPKYVEGVARR